ncbi:MAG: YciI family protein [Candidatus Eremiobacteraeota bacterium]|nr:YciI family protein [Candidatus Eremiobacteraeota bacterium]
MPYFVVVRERSSGWTWSLPMRRQAVWDAHAAFMDALVSEGFIVAGGPLGDEDRAPRVMHVVSASDTDAVESRMQEDPWTPMRLLSTVSIDPWTILLGSVRA